MVLSKLLDVSFSLLEWLAITGLTQSILILTYVIVRLYNWKQAILPIAYFSMLGIAFCVQFALRIEAIEDILRLFLWSAWALLPPLSYLLILQIAYSLHPKLREYWVVMLPIFAFSFVFIVNKTGGICETSNFYSCDKFFEWLHLSSGIMGAICMLFLFGHSDLFQSIKKNSKNSNERYWLIISLILMNMGSVAINMIRVTDKYMSQELADAVLIIIGLGFVYLTTTMFFRIYPPAISLIKSGSIKKTKSTDVNDLSDKEYKIALKINDLIKLEKLYQEPSYSRADMARELNISENVISSVINTAFGKTFPQLMNENRVEDAKRMLKDQTIPVQVIAFEVGFNSLPSFNRVFKSLTGKPPSIYRSDNCSHVKKT